MTAPTLATLSQPPSDWDVFVRSRPAASVYLLSGWALLLREVFGHEAYFIEAREDRKSVV